MCDSNISGHVRVSHSRESSVSLASNDSNVSTGLVLSVSGLSKRGTSKEGTCKDSPRSEDDSGMAGPGSDTVSVSSDQGDHCQVRDVNEILRNIG